MHGLALKYGAFTKRIHGSLYLRTPIIRIKLAYTNLSHMKGDYDANAHSREVPT